MKSRFIGRINELNYLREKYNSPGQQFVVVHGRRRVGKSTLLRKFVSEVGGIYHQAIESSEKDQLHFLGTQLSREIDGYEQTFSTLHALLEYVFRRLVDLPGKSLLVVDEFPYYAKNLKSLPSLLQLLLDQDETRDIMIVVCGSEISTMQELMGSKSPLYGRRTGSLHVKPFSFHQISGFFPSTDVNTLLKIYGVLGGMPSYLRLYDPAVGFETNITRLFVDPGELSDEYINILRYEFSSIANYNAILRAMSVGRTRISEIASETGIDARTVPEYLNKLAAVSLVQKILPLESKERSRLTRYRITDNLISFHHHFFGSLSTISPSFTDDEFSSYMGRVLEEVTKELLQELNANGLLFHEDRQIRLKHLGNWWKSDMEIDLVGTGSHGIAVECKYGINTDGFLLRKALSHKLERTPWKGYTPVIVARGYRRKDRNCLTIEELYDALCTGSPVTIS